MATLTLDVPETLKERVEPFSRYLPTILEISLLGLSTPAACVASEMVTFLSSNPSQETVQNYHVSEQAQARLDNLLEQNREGKLNQSDLAELDELLELGHVMIMLKASLPHQTI
jgi:hypothetical protein